MPFDETNKSDATKRSFLCRARVTRGHLVRSTHRLLLVALCLLVSNGCIGSASTLKDEATGDTTGQATPPALSDDQSNAAFGRRGDESGFDNDETYDDDDRNISIIASRPEKLVVEFEVFRISAPAGTFDETSPIWEIASGVLPNVNRNLRLQANGFLVAIGRKSDRELLVDYIDSVAGREVISDRVMPNAARLLDVELGRRKGKFSLFRYDEAGTLRGVEFESPLPRFRLRTQFRSANLHKTWLELLPQLEEPDGPSTWVVEEGQTPVLKPQKRRHTFDSLAFGVEIPSGGFLLVGPTSAIQDRPLLARAFFLETNADAGAGPQRENIFIVRPIVRAVPIGTRDAMGDDDDDPRVIEEDGDTDAPVEDELPAEEPFEDDEGFDPAGAFRPQERELEAFDEQEALDAAPTDESDE